MVVTSKSTRADDDRGPTRSGDARVVRLLSMGPEYAAHWWRWREQASSQRYNPLLPLSVEHLARRLSTACTADLSNRTKREYRWVVEYDGEPVGTVCLEQPAWRMGYAEIGYMMAEEFHGRGIGTRAVALLIDKAFRESDLHRLYASIADDNIASIRLIEKLGFTREGAMRQHYTIQGRRVDEIIYGLLRSEWSRTSSQRIINKD